MQTQHAWLIRDNVGAPIALNIRINQWRFNLSTGVRTIAIWWTAFFPHCLLTSVMNVSKEIKNTKFAMIERRKLYWISYKFSNGSLPTLSHPILHFFNLRLLPLHKFYSSIGEFHCFQSVIVRTPSWFMPLNAAHWLTNKKIRCDRWIDRIFKLENFLDNIQFDRWINDNAGERWHKHN